MSSFTTANGNSQGSKKWSLDYPSFEGCELSRGNLKLGKDTLVLNITSARDCPSKKLGLCKWSEICYAARPEAFRPSTLPYRERQAAYYEKHTALNIARAILEIIKKIENSKSKAVIPIRFIRFSESGDFKNQQDVNKLSEITRIIHSERQRVVVYGYTARADLNFVGVPFIVRGSGYSIPGSAGITEVVPKGSSVPNGFKVCPMDCRKCSLCKIKKGNVAFISH